MEVDSKLNLMDKKELAKGLFNPKINLLVGLRDEGTGTGIIRIDLYGKIPFWLFYNSEGPDKIESLIGQKLIKLSELAKNPDSALPEMEEAKGIPLEIDLVGFYNGMVSFQVIPYTISDRVVGLGYIIGDSHMIRIEADVLSRLLMISAACFIPLREDRILNEMRENHIFIENELRWALDADQTQGSKQG